VLYVPPFAMWNEGLKPLPRRGPPPNLSMLPGAPTLDLTFLPVPARPWEGRLLLYAPGQPERVPQSAAVAAIGLGGWLLRLEPKSAVLMLPAGRVGNVNGLAMQVPGALPALAMMRAIRRVEPGKRPMPASIRAWSQAAKLALELIGREELVPAVRQDERRIPRAIWSVALLKTEDRDRRDLLAAAFPPSACATILDPTSRPPLPWMPPALLGAFLDCVGDGLVRGATTAWRARAAAAAKPSWESRVVRALTTRENTLAADSQADTGLIAALSSWSAPLLERSPQPLRVAMELVPPNDENGVWLLHYHLQSTADLGAIVAAKDVWAARGKTLAIGGRAFDSPEQLLLRGLAEAARISPPVERTLHEKEPVTAKLSTEEAWAFLSRTSPVLGQSGFGILLPSGLEELGKKRLRARVRLGVPTVAQVFSPDGANGNGNGNGSAEAPSGSGAGALTLSTLGSYRWEVALGDDALTEEEFRAISARQAPLVRWRGQWVAVDPEDLERSKKLLAAEGGLLQSGQGLAALVSGRVEIPGVGSVEVVADGDMAGLASWLKSGEGGAELEEPKGFEGQLRPYQRRGVGWLLAMERYGLGACLADDMGLGKTIQVIALLLHRSARTLLVCPTSVVGNWERELRKFAPRIPVARHHGTQRTRTGEELQRTLAAGGVVLTTYALVRRDEALLATMKWERIVLDEAQSIKNSAARQTKAIRNLLAAAASQSPNGLAGVSRAALTGTPVENRLAELWSILDFCNPGLLGSLDSFRRRFAVPIERLQDEAVANRLKGLVRPFVLRRLKADPAVALSLPEKNEMSVVTTLTREQATLYQAQVDEAMNTIKGSSGVQRRGRILALITALKQICNHPSQFLKEDSGPAELAHRSGKLQRLREMLEETTASGDRSLVFTQFKQMGDRLVTYLEKELGEEVLFLHGGVSAPDRDELVRRFQENTPDAPKIFVLSLKAGGLGLNLTAATSVFHFDRWWNPAVEDQATNRAHRIGQTRNVSVFKLVTAGTLEERIDKLLESKRGLAEKVLGAGETWLTDMNDEELRTLLELGSDADVEAPEETMTDAEDIA